MYNIYTRCSPRVPYLSSYTVEKLKGHLWLLSLCHYQNQYISKSFHFSQILAHVYFCMFLFIARILIKTILFWPGPLKQSPNQVLFPFIYYTVAREIFKKQPNPGTLMFKKFRLILSLSLRTQYILDKCLTVYRTLHSLVPAALSSLVL